MHVHVHAHAVIHHVVLKPTSTAITCFTGKTTCQSMYIHVHVYINVYIHIYMYMVTYNYVHVHCVYMYMYTVDEAVKESEAAVQC